MIEERFTITDDFDVYGEKLVQIRNNGKVIMGCFNKTQAEPIVNLLNEQYARIKELKRNNDMKFWKHQFMEQYNSTQMIIHELSMAIQQGYETSDKFKKYIEELKQFNEERMQKAKEQDQW